MSTSRKPFIVFTILVLLLQLSTKVYTAEVPMTVPTDITIHTVNNPNSFLVELPQTEYDQTYIGIVKPEQIYPGPTCTFNPSTFWPVMGDSYGVPATWLAAGASYRLDSYLTYRFLSKSSTSSVYALNYGEIIPAVPANALTGGVQMVINPSGSGTMYILNNQGGFSYDLTAFITNVAVVAPATPVVNTLGTADTFAFTIPLLNDARFDPTNNRIYVRAGNEIGYITTPLNTATYTSIFTEIAGHGALKDFAIRGNYVYALQEEALYVRFMGVPARTKQFDLRRGRFLRISGNTILVVSDTSSIVYEYFIADDTSVADIEQVITLNRHVPIQHGNQDVSGVEIDDHYLYLATNINIIAVRHSIPQAFSLTLKNYGQEVYTLYPGSTVKFISGTPGGESKFITASGVNVYEYKMTLKNPQLYCTADAVAGCKFTSKIESYQRRCPGFLPPSDMCKLTQTIFINVLESSTACPDSTKPAEGLAVTPGLIYQVSGFISENGQVHQTQKKNQYVRKTRPSNFTVEPHYNQTRNIERAKNYTGRHNNIFNQATPVDQSSTRIPLPPTGGSAPTSAKTEEQPVMKTETMTPENDTEKNGEIIEMINENKELMNGLVISMVAMFVILSLFIVFVIWHFASKKTGENEKNETVQEDEKSGFVVIPDARKKPKIDLNVSQLHTFVDESKIHTDTDV